VRKGDWLLELVWKAIFYKKTLIAVDKTSYLNTPHSLAVKPPTTRRAFHRAGHDVGERTPAASVRTGLAIPRLLPEQRLYDHDDKTIVVVKMKPIGVVASGSSAAVAPIQVYKQRELDAKEEAFVVVRDEA
jgi:hypothetical protein